MSPRPRFLRIAAFSLVAAIFGVPVGLALRGEGESRPTMPAEVAQVGVATVSGISLRVIGATFSGSGTDVRFSTDLTGMVTADAVAQVTALNSDFTGLLRPMDGLNARFWSRAGGDTTLRLTPSSPGEKSEVIVARMRITSVDGTETILEGPWTINLVQPADLASAIRVERMIADHVASDAGLSVTVLGASRTTAETVITVQLDPGTLRMPLDVLAPPTILVDGESVIGALVRKDSSGQRLDLVFPPTAFGSKIALDLQSWIQPAPGTPQFTDIDFGASLVRTGIKTAKDAGGAPEDFTFGPTETHVSAGGALTPITAAYFNTAHFKSGDVPTIGFRLRGNFIDESEFRVVLTDGTIVPSLVGGTNYHKDLAGVISEGESGVEFARGDIDRWRGTIRFFHGEPSSIVSGNWRIVPLQRSMSPLANSAPLSPALMTPAGSLW